MRKRWVKYISKEIMALRVGPIPKKCNVSNHGIAILIYSQASSLKLVLWSVNFWCNHSFNPFASEAVYIHKILFLTAGRTACKHGGRLNMHSVFWEFCRKPCQHATRGCDKRWMTCIHAGVSRSLKEHASVPPDKRHCRQWMSSLFCGFLPNPFIHDLFCWSSRHKFVKTDL